MKQVTPHALKAGAIEGTFFSVPILLVVGIRRLGSRGEWSRSQRIIRQTVKNRV